ncbi:hypothetical protein O3M35_007167 [Rhynocoris fuscipes]|uniref:Nucleolus and neural progenitor protein-like N-terminal domain-containing protein n=1 Tax=Rhynocoris fuscipes TaxID=488301 RepID=A0AAW1D979_9HEMI
MEENLLNIPYWNQKNLTPPEMISRALICKKPKLVRMNLTKLLKDIQSELKQILNYLNTDGALFSRLIYRMKKVFRHDKTLQGMQKINKCLTNVLSINLVYTINELDVCTYEENGPTKEMLQWTMLSFQRLAALLNALINRCSATVPSLKNKVDTGHHWNIGIVTLGVIARIWLLSRHLCLKSCEWYKELNEFIGKNYGYQ